MKIERTTVETMTMEAFAEKYELTMVITEREKSSYREPFQAQLKGVSVSEDGGFRDVFGEGSTETEAIFDYANLISCKRVLFIDRQLTRHHISAPVLTYNARGKACPPEPKAAKPVKTRRNSSPAPTAE